jgi:hypothetical protein
MRTRYHNDSALDFFTFLIACVVMLLLSGCVVVRFPTDKGTFTYIAPAFGVKSIGDVDLKNGTLTNYRSEQSQMAEAISAGVSAGVAQALTKGAK